MEPLSTLGASAASSLSHAFEASSIIVVCIDNYDLSRRLVSENDLGQYLSGRTLIQLTTGTPKEAREFEQFIHGFDCEYLDGAIMVYPEGIGTEDGQLLFSGPQEIYNRCLSILSCLSGDLRYLGSNISGAAALDMALLTQDLCSSIGVIHGALICESENISVGEFADTFPEGSNERNRLEIIQSDKYDDTGATLAVWNKAFQRVQTQAQDSEINGEVPDFISSLLKRALAAGYGEEDIVSIMKVMRN
jgi:3-hydroxyisobutyrate dehydrogenase-like beta-hydroxyacid dehydrogenase